MSSTSARAMTRGYGSAWPLGVTVRPLGQVACLALLTLGVAGGPAARPAGLTPAAKPPVVTIVATDYAFAAPDTLAAGATTVHLINRGKELHQAWLVRFAPGKGAEDFEAAMQGGGPFPAWATPVGGANAPAPGGGEANATLALGPGHYAVICIIPSADGTPHLMKGMVHPFTVTASRNASALPPADVDVVLRDYEFQMSRPLTAGHHVLAVRTDAAQPHEVELVRLAPDVSLERAIAWLEKPEGPPLATPIGGVAPLARGAGTNEFAVDLPAGHYAFICFLPDAKDGKPHYAHGMVKELTVR